MTSLNSITLEASDTKAAETFYAATFGLGDRVRVSVSHAATTGFRGFTLSLITSQPANVSTLFDPPIPHRHVRPHRRDEDTRVGIHIHVYDNGLIDSTQSPP